MARVGLITLTFRDRASFAELASRNVCKQTRAPDLWIVVADESPECESAYAALARGPDVYLTCTAATIGEKRNFAVEAASVDVVLFADDDDFYVETYVEIALRELGERNVGLVGCADMLVTFPLLDYQACYVRGSYVHEATCCFTKEHWRKYRFGNTNRGEGRPMCAGSFWNALDVRRVMICIAHGTNTFPKDHLLNDATRVTLPEALVAVLDEHVGHLLT